MIHGDKGLEKKEEFRRLFNKEDQGKLYTFTGRKVDVVNPSDDQIKMEDIIHHLSNACRWTGACKHFYSVAQHTVLGTRALLEKGEIGTAKHFFLHDNSEAYMTDVSRTVKDLLSNYRPLEDKIQDVIYRKFLSDKEYKEVPVTKKLMKYIDGQMLIKEMGILINNGFFYDVEDREIKELEIELWYPPKAKEEMTKLFLDLFC